ncbi:MAG: hypothetical protein K9M45_01270, partial [Kiritimatiellales bacterium]|nr:hypothetical protein [Kiritimatiellales bacterium]
NVIVPQETDASIARTRIHRNDLKWPFRRVGHLSGEAGLELGYISRGVLQRRGEVNIAEPVNAQR